MSDTPKEIPLEDIDKLLEAEDPDFAKSLEEVRSVEVDSSVVIEAAAIDETDSGDDMELAERAEGADTDANFVTKLRRKIKSAIRTARQRSKERLLKFVADTILFLKTRPKEYALYSFAMAKRAVAAVRKPVQSFMAAPRILQLAILTFITIIALTLTVFRANLQGIWIPHLMEPILMSLADHADFVETYDPSEGRVSFHVAFPQERHEFLFKKFKVNLRRTSGHPNPMGAFEIVVEGDSKDTAIELNQREVELHDLLQRLFEEESYNDLDSELGRTRVKGRIKRDLNAKLTQGWIREVYFKTYILKP